MVDVIDLKKRREEKNKRLAEDLHSKERYDELHDEWVKYHGIVEHPETGKETSIQELLQEELSTRVEDIQKELKDRIKKGEKDVEKLKDVFWEYAKRAYLAREGRKKEPTDKKEKEIFYDNVRAFVVQAANEAGVPTETFEHALAEFLAADNPIYGKKEEQRSKILDTLIKVYAQDSHEGKSEHTKDLSLRRLGVIERDLSTDYHSPHWHVKYGGILEQYDYPAKFKKSAKSKEVMKTITDLLNTGETDVKTSYIHAPKGYVRPKKLKKAVGS